MRPATLRPYPEHSGRRPVALRPTLSSGLPFSSRHRWRGGGGSQLSVRCPPILRVQCVPRFLATACGHSHPLCAHALDGIAQGSGHGTGEDSHHRRELKVFSPVKPHVNPSCHPLLSAMWTHSLFQPGPHRGFLMASTPRPAAQKAAQARQTHLDPGLRPRALHLLAHGVQLQPAQQPTAHHRDRGRGGGAQQGAELRCRAGGVPEMLLIVLFSQSYQSLGSIYQHM